MTWVTVKQLDSGVNVMHRYFTRGDDSIYSSDLLLGALASEAGKQLTR